MKAGKRIRDDHPLLSWLPRFAGQVISKRSIGADGKDGRSTENGTTMAETSCALWREKVWCRGVGEDGGSTCASRLTQGVYVGFHDRTASVLCITEKTVMPQAWEKLCGTPSWQVIAPEVRLQKKLTADKEGGGTSLPSTSCRASADVEARGQTAGCPECLVLMTCGTT